MVGSSWPRSSTKSWRKVAPARLIDCSNTRGFLNLRAGTSRVTRLNEEHFQLTAARALPDRKLHPIYADGQSFEVDFRPWIASTPALRRLKDTAPFAKAKVGVGGRSVDWIQDGLDLGADNLRNLAIEQAGGIGHERIWNWLHDTGLTSLPGNARPVFKLCPGRLIVVSNAKTPAKPPHFTGRASGANIADTAQRIAAAHSHISGDRHEALYAPGIHGQPPGSPVHCRK